MKCNSRKEPQLQKYRIAQTVSMATKVMKSPKTTVFEIFSY
jgi:hypothetical protein